MKTTTIAATAALLGSVTADGWEGWSNSATPKSADPTSKSADPTWTEWASTSKTPDADSNTWSEWSSTTSKTPAVKTSTDPAWGDWEGANTSSSKPNTATSKDPEWENWSTATSSKPVTKTSTDPNWSDWASTTSSKPAVKTSTDPAWGEWEDPSKKTTSTKPADPKTTQEGWGSWEDPKEPTVTLKSTSTQWVTVTVYHNDGGQTWSAWSEPAVKTATDSKTVIVSKTVTKTTSTGVSSWGQWAEPSLVVDPGCKLEVSLSYGLPIWIPTASVNWEDWNTASSTKPAVKTTSTAVTSWGEWESSTSSKPAVKTSTDPATWSNWEDPSKKTTTSSKPSVPTSANGDWSNWGSEAKDGKSNTDAVASWSAWNSATGSKTTSSGGAAQTWGSWNQDGNGISANGNKFGITYSPYTADSQCKDQGTVNKDIAAMAAKGFTSVRVYSTDCKTLEYVGQACRDNKMKVILGVFISETGISGAQPQVDAIAKWAQWDLVELIVVGNEAVFGGRCSAADLAGFIASSKATFKGAGFKGAVSTTDELSVWQSYGSAWCDVVDVVTANLYAFFNPNTAAEDAGSFIQAQISDLSKICPGKAVYVMESGWPSAGECNGKACPSPENQATAIKGIQAAVGAKVVFFSYEDEAWKQPGQFNVEQHWGCGSLFN